MRLAVFTNQFPNRVSTFFARDICGLIDAGIEIDIFPIYPLDRNLWRYVPDVLNEKLLPRSRVHHLSLAQCLAVTRWLSSKKLLGYLSDMLAISKAAVQYGVEPLAKSSYVFLKAWIWAQQHANRFDHVFAYWGNYAGTCAYLFHRLLAEPIPFSIFLHAGTDLYRSPIFMRQKLLYADNIVTCSEFNDQFIRERYADIASGLASKIHVHHHGLDLSEFSFSGKRRPPNKIIAVGRLEKEKGYEHLIRAVQQLKNNGLPVTLEIVGDGSEVNHLKLLSQQLNINDTVIFRGWLTPNETRRAMTEASVLVHPSPALGDGVPNVIKECMALGTPVVASSIAGIPELLANGKHGVLVPPKDVKALAGAIMLLLSDVQRQHVYATLARGYAEERFDMWRNGRCLADLFCSTRRDIVHH